MKNQILIADSVGGDSLKHVLETISNAKCDLVRDIENRRIRKRSYDLIFVHLSMLAGENKPASVIRKQQKNAFIVGVGGESKRHYSEEDLKDCDEFFEKLSKGVKEIIPYYRSLLNDAGVPIR